MVMPTVTAQRPSHTLFPSTWPQVQHTRLPQSRVPRPPSVLPARLRLLLLAGLWAHGHELAQLLHMPKTVPAFSWLVTGCQYWVVREREMCTVFSPSMLSPIGLQARHTPGSSHSFIDSGLGCCTLDSPHTEADVGALDCWDPKLCASTPSM